MKKMKTKPFILHLKKEGKIVPCQEQWYDATKILFSAYHKYRKYDKNLKKPPKILKFSKGNQNEWILKRQIAYANQFPDMGEVIEGKYKAYYPLNHFLGYLSKLEDKYWIKIKKKEMKENMKNKFLKKTLK